MGNDTIKAAGLLPLLVVLIAGANPAAAAFKCVDAQGQITFSQTGCATGEESSEVTMVQAQAGGGSTTDAATCDLAGLYAEDVAQRMREGSDYAGEMDAHGGSYGAKPSKVALVNYVHSFRKVDADPGRIGKLARAKCLVGGFGRIAPEDLPASDYSFDSNQGNWGRRAASGAVPQGGTAPAAGVQGNGCEQTMAGMDALLKQLGSGSADAAKLKEQLKRGCN